MVLMTNSRAQFRQRRVLRVSEVAAQLGVCTNTVRNEFREGRLQGVRVGKLILISLDSFEAYLAFSREHEMPGKLELE
jgi:excisionase family DNA binding protein